MTMTETTEFERSITPEQACTSWGCRHPAKYEVRVYQTWNGPTDEWKKVCGVHRNELLRRKGYYEENVRRARLRDENNRRLAETAKTGLALSRKLRGATGVMVEFVAKEHGRGLMLTVEDAEKLLAGEW